MCGIYSMHARAINNMTSCLQSRSTFLLFRFIFRLEQHTCIILQVDFPGFEFCRRAPTYQSTHAAPWLTLEQWEMFSILWSFLIWEYLQIYDLRHTVRHYLEHQSSQRTRHMILREIKQTLRVKTGKEGNTVYPQTDPRLFIEKLIVHFIGKETEKVKRS